MKLTIVIVFAACLQLSAGGYGQKVSLQVEHADLANIFQEIRNQTGWKAPPAYRLNGSVQLDSIVRGNVTDTTGTPLPGVSVLIKGTNTGTSTDMDGNYRLQVDEWTQRLNLFSTEQENYLEGRTVDWYGLVMNGTALRQNYDLSVSGGTEKVKYYWSMGYLDNEGLITGDRYSALQSRLNMDAALNDQRNLKTEKI